MKKKIKTTKKVMSKISKRFKNYKGKSKCSEFDFGKPKGKEVW